MCMHPCYQRFKEQERRSYEEGWTKPAQINFPALGVMAGQLLLADTENTLSQVSNLYLIERAVQDVFALRDPLRGVLMNATCALAGSC